LIAATSDSLRKHKRQHAQITASQSAVCSMWTQTLAGGARCPRDRFCPEKSLGAVASGLDDAAGDDSGAIPATMKRATAVQASAGCSTGKTSFLPIFDVTR